MFRSLTFRIIGVTPLVMHNGQLANPLNVWSKRLKAVTGKRTKTDADYEEMARLEWLGGLYLKDGKPCIPGEVVEGTLVSAAKRSKTGKQAQAGLICPDAALLEFDGNRAIEDLWQDEDYRLTVGCKVGQARIMRTRPKFNQWAATITVQYDDSLLNERQVVDFFTLAGQNIGMCDWRPKFGRFEVEQVKV